MQKGNTMKDYTVAILGATGAVGTQMLQCLEEQDFPVGKLRLLASARSAGKTLSFRGEDIVIEEATPESFAGCDIVLGAADDAIAKKLLPAAVEAGATVVDNSHAFRMDPEVTPRISLGTTASSPIPTARPSSRSCPRGPSISSPA